MIFAEKLNFLMQLTSTTNSRLASAINVDPSLISKLRSGVRSVSVKSDYLLPMSNYFGSKCGDSYRTLTLLELIGADFGSDVVSSLVKWFLDDEKTIDISHSETVFCGNVLKRKQERRVKEKFISFHGLNGVYEAIELMKEIIASSQNIRTVKLFSDCSNGDGNFDLFLSCNDYWYELAEKGTEIIRILPDFYSLNQSLNDVLAWLPILSSGRGKSFYFNGFRGRSENTLMIIVPGVAAMFSVSVNGNGPTVVTTDKTAVDGFGKMFDSYLSFCKQASLTEHYSGRMNGFVEDFLEIQDDLCCIFNSAFCDRFAEENVYCKYEEQLKILMKTNRVTEIFPLCSLTEVSAKKTAYTAKQYSERLEAIAALLESEPNYRVIISSDINDSAAGILIKRKGGLLSLPDNPNGFYGLVTHQPSVNALWQYYMNGYNGISVFDSSKENVISQIKNLISGLNK